MPGKLPPSRVHLDSFNDAEMMMVTLVTVMETIKMVMMVVETMAMVMLMRMMVKMTSMSPRVHLDSLNCAGYRVVHSTSSGTAAR